MGVETFDASPRGGAVPPECMQLCGPVCLLYPGDIIMLHVNEFIGLSMSPQ